VLSGDRRAVDVLQVVAPVDDSGVAAELCLVSRVERAVQGDGVVVAEPQLTLGVGAVELHVLTERLQLAASTVDALRGVAGTRR
jgi:hypothetical protein